MLPIINGVNWFHSNKNDKLETLRAAISILEDRLQAERDSRARLLKYLDVKEIAGPVIVPMVEE